MAMSNIIKFKRKPRPLRKTYNPEAPYEVYTDDDEDGGIIYEVIDVRPSSYRIVSSMNDEFFPYAKHDAEQIARGLNLLVCYGMELLPKITEEPWDGNDD